MKIIRQGKKTFTGYCTRCDCIFEYEIQDIDGSDMVECPDCGHKNLHFLNQTTSTDYINTDDINSINVLEYDYSKLNPQITIS